jgi:hypothetical protein
MQDLLRLIYTSRATIPFETDAIESLLAKARRNNYNNRITGILSFSHGHFLQVLEGAETEVVPLYARILQDGRHRDCVIISVQLIRTRLFPNWSMGHDQPNSRVGSRYKRVAGLSDGTDDLAAAQRLLDDLFKIVME